MIFTGRAPVNRAMYSTNGMYHPQHTGHHQMYPLASQNVSYYGSQRTTNYPSRNHQYNQQMYPAGGYYSQSYAGYGGRMPYPPTAVSSSSSSTTNSGGVNTNNSSSSSGRNKYQQQHWSRSSNK